MKPAPPALHPTPGSPAERLLLSSHRSEGGGVGGTHVRPRVPCCRNGRWLPTVLQPKRRHKEGRGLPPTPDSAEGQWLGRKLPPRFEGRRLQRSRTVGTGPHSA